MLHDSTRTLAGAIQNAFYHCLASCLNEEFQIFYLKFKKYCFIIFVVKVFLNCHFHQERKVAVFDI